MGITADNELAIRKALANTVASIPEAGFVIPAPLFCNDIADFWATLDGINTDTRDQIETTNIAATWIYPLQFVDDFTSGKPDSPLILFSYEFYLFRQYAFDREDETSLPDVFNSQILKRHNRFIKAWLDIKSAFQGNRNIAALDPAVFALKQTTSIVQNAFIDDRATCKFVPGVVGFAVSMTEMVRIKLEEC